MTQTVDTEHCCVRLSPAAADTLRAADSAASTVSLLLSTVTGSLTESDCSRSLLSSRTPTDLNVRGESGDS